MTGGKKVTVSRETSTGRNTRFRDGGRTLTRKEFVREIKRGDQPEYHVRKVNGVDTPCSNPDRSKRNNLG